MPRHVGDKTSDSQRLAIEARRRGVPLRLIAASLGVSFQAVADKIKRFEARTGEKIIVGLLPAKHTPRPVSFAICQHCKKSFQTDGRRIFCTRKCATDATRLLPEAIVKRAISMRESGQTWTHISNLLGWPIQSLQQRIWMYLHERGLLAEPLISRLWSPSSSLFRKSSSWKWLENKSGRSP